MSKKKTRINPELIEQNNLKLKQYADEVNRLQVDIEANDALSINHGKIALELALKAGAALREAKELVPHGEWEKWIADNVKGVELRTAQNYMKLAQEKAIVLECKKNNAEFGMKTKYVAFFEECQSLREAYIAVGIIKKTPATDGTGEVEQSPEIMKRDNEQKYNQLLNTARQVMLTYVRSQIETSNKHINWDLGTWTIKNNKPCSGDESNFAAKLFHTMLSWISFRNNSSLTRDDEVQTKAGIVLNEVVKAILLATTTAKTDDTKPEVVDTVPFFTFEPNAKPVEVQEVVEPVSV